MTVTVRFFGPLTDVFPASLDIDISLPASKENLEAELHSHFPALGNRAFQIAVDRTMIPPDGLVERAAEISLLPPFSGG
ncbi:MAG: MoaD/ThiS family protein [Spirochaetales bacterium]|nr:MoaD/ThiS family protein [Spirochaetales bacterium]